MLQESGPPRTTPLERLGVALILLVGMVPRLRDVVAPFDREAEGAQAAFFAIAAVNYERLGIGRAGGYPVLNVDAMRETRPGVLLPIRGQEWLIYANHPPLVPLVAWAALEVLGPAGWSEAWREGRPPEGIELPIRLPFVVAHALFLLALWWAMRQSHGPRAAMIALALAAATPVLSMYATLVNYENPALLFALLAAGFHARWLRAGRLGDLGWFALHCLLGSCVTYAGGFFLLFFVLAAFAGGLWARGLAELTVGGAATLAPLAAHGLWTQRVAQRTGQDLPGPLERAREILGPLFDGSLPIGSWGTLQVERLGPWIGWPLVVLALAGLALLFARLSQPRLPPALQPRWQRIDIGAPLLLGGGLYLLAFYRHSYDPQHTFLMLAAPGFVALAAVALDALADPLERLRADVAPLVLLVSSIALLGVHQSNGLRHRYRATPEQAARLRVPSPAFPLPDATGADIARLIPPGSVGLYPADTGLNLAVNFYAWRSLAPLSAADDQQAQAIARAVGLDQAPRYLLLPVPAPPEAERQTATLQAALIPPGVEFLAGERWKSAPLP